MELSRFGKTEGYGPRHPRAIMETQNRTPSILGGALLTTAILACATLACATPGAPVHKESSMIAKGSFEVKLSLQPAAEGDGPIGRLLMDKQFTGELSGKSRGQMLGAQAPDGSGGYVAMELVTAELAGKRGTFVLQHKGTMRRNADFRMDVTVVPGSGTGELAGITGTLTILIEGGVHRYLFEYAFEA
jgi:hypothetical protein